MAKESSAGGGLAAMLVGLVIAILSTLIIAAVWETVGFMLIIAFIVPFYGVFMFVGGLVITFKLPDTLMLLLLVVCEIIMLVILFNIIFQSGAVVPCYKLRC